MEQHPRRGTAEGFAEYQIDLTVQVLLDVCLQLFGGGFRGGEGRPAAIIAVRADGDDVMFLRQQWYHILELLPAHHVAGDQDDLFFVPSAEFMDFHYSFLR